MGDLSQTLKCVSTTILIILFIFLLSSSSSSSSSSIVSSSTQQIKAPPSSSAPIIPHRGQVFDLKNNDPIFQERFKKKHRKKNKNKKTTKNKARPFSVMLPKGYVPPSRSSPCHNQYPTSMSSFHCHLTNRQN